MAYTRRRAVRHEDHAERYDGGPSEVVSRSFGGIDLGASFSGMLAALALLVLLGGVAAAAIGIVTFRADAQMNGQEAAMGGLVAGAVVLFLSFLVGGWAAGRMARYDGGVNGLITGVWMLVLMAVFAGLGAWLDAQYNVLLFLQVPDWFNVGAGQDLTTVAAVSGVVAILLMLLAGFLGGMLGERYHRAADDALLAVATRWEEPVHEEHRHVETHPVVEDDEEEVAGERRPLTTWPDEELIERRRALAQEESRTGPTLSEIDEELRRRGYEPARV